MASKEKLYAVINIGYNEFVLDLDQAQVVFRALVAGGIERFNTRYNSNTQESEPMVSPMDENSVSLKLMDPERYAMGKLLYAADQKAKQEAKLQEKQT